MIVRRDQNRVPCPDCFHVGHRHVGHWPRRSLRRLSRRTNRRLQARRSLLLRGLQLLRRIQLVRTRVPVDALSPPLRRWRGDFWTMGLGILSVFVFFFLAGFGFFSTSFEKDLSIGWVHFEVKRVLAHMRILGVKWTGPKVP